MWKIKPALSLHCSQHNMVLWNLEWRGSEIGPGMLYRFCSWLTFTGPSLFPLRKYNGLFFHSVETPQLTTAPQRPPLLLDWPCQCLDSAGMGWSLRSCSLVASLNIAVLGSKETPHWGNANQNGSKAATGDINLHEEQLSGSTSRPRGQVCQNVNCCSVTQSCLTLCDPVDCSTPGLPVHHQLPEFTQTHVHWVSDAIQPSHPLLFPSPPAFNLSQHQSFLKCQLFASGGLSIGASASALVLPMNIQGWFPLDWLVWSPCCPRHSQESSSAPQFKSINSSMLRALVEQIYYQSIL